MTEGRAGMAAIVDTDNLLDLTKLSEGMSKNLPPYARPIFIRVIQNIPMTSKYDHFNLNYLGGLGEL